MSLLAPARPEKGHPTGGGRIRPSPRAPGSSTRGELGTLYTTVMARNTSYKYSTYIPIQNV